MQDELEKKILKGAASAKDRIQYGYDRDGNVLYQNNLIDPTISDLYTYDGLNRLTGYEQGELSSDHTSIPTPLVSLGYTLDALGNQLTGIGGANTINDQNEMTGYGTTTRTNMTYDNNGNTLTDFQGLTYTYDAWNRSKPKGPRRFMGFCQS